MNRTVKQNRRLSLRPACVLLCASTLWMQGTAPAQTTFDQQRQAIAIAPATQPEQAIRAMLETGLAEHKPTQAIALTEQWLRENVAEDPLLLYHAGRAAELSGDWQSASALYRQYLKRADLKSKEADDAILATYTLLINQLADPESAYAYARSDGNALVASAQARQFDRWFLDESIRRNDHEAVAARLLALVEAKVSNDLLIALYEPYFNWLLQQVATYRLDMERFSPRFVETTRALAKGIAFDDELKLLMDWEVSAKAYNMALLAGQSPALPIAQARALLERYPHYAERVQTCWAGGHRGRYYRDDPKKYWPVDLETKLAPVNTAAAGLDELARARFERSWEARYFDGGPVVMSAEQARAWVLANPKRANTKTAPALSLNWNTLSVEEAGKLAPNLQHNPSPEASLVRIIAAVGESKDFNKAIDLLLGEEAWRLGTAELNGTYADQLWHWCGRPGDSATRDQAIKRSKAVLDTYQQQAVKKQDPADKRMARFNALWNDYTSPKPTMPAVRSRLLETLMVTPEALPTLLNESGIEADLLLRDALEAGIAGTTEADTAYDRNLAVPTDRYDPCFVRLMLQHRFNDVASFKQQRASAYLPHPLGQAIHEALSQQIKQGKAEPWLVLAWLNTRFPDERLASAELARQLQQMPVWESMPYEVRRGARDLFSEELMNDAQVRLIQNADAKSISDDLLALPEDAELELAVGSLKSTIEALRQSPIRHEPLGLDRLGRLNDAVFNDPKVVELMFELVGDLRVFNTDNRFGERLFRLVADNPDPAIVHRLSPYLWRHTEVHHRTLAGMIDLADALDEDQPSAASALSRAGLQTIARHRSGHTYYNSDTDIPRLRSIRGRAALAMGLIDIPVPKSDPAYGIYQSQAEFAIGNQASARELYVDHADALMPIHRRLSVSYLLWVLQHTIDDRDELAQEELAKALMAWMQGSPGAFSLEQRVQLEIAYGDIALQRGMLPEAHTIFARIRKNPSYEPVYTRHTATLRQVLVERVSGDYDAALQTLMELDAEKVPRLKTEAHYARAEVYYAMEDYQDAADEIVKVLQREPDHADATILRGRVQLKLQRLIEATEVELGSATSQATLVPGEMLKVTLNDPTLTVSSGGTDIEVVVWSTSGDREHILLRQFGDQKTKYRGEVRTALGKPNPDDRTLQIVGEDEIYYAYSDAFRKKMTNLEENRGGPITVASDAMMMASARKLLSENEQRVADMRAATEILESRHRTSVQNVDPQMLAQILAEAADRARKTELEARVKPGNPIYLRVIDPDRGRTAEIDELSVSVTSSSGDVVGSVVLRETGTHTGQFEGLIETAEAQALAFGSTSETGRNPNMVISPKSDYPAWRPERTPDAGHYFTVDLNDNAALGTLRIDASDEGYALKRFIVQTAMNQDQWTTLASYPASKVALADPCKPSVMVALEEGLRAPRGARSVYELDALRKHMETGWLADAEMALAMNVDGPSAALPEAVRSQKQWSWQGRDKNPAVVVRFQAYFYEPVSTTRRFAMTLGNYNNPSKDKNKQNEPEFLIAVDGRVITSQENNQLQGEINLKPGLHRIEIWATGWIDAIGLGRNVTLRANLDDPDTLVDCPDTFFDPATFPEGTLDHRNAPASITANDAGTRFDVAFAPGARARMIRLLFVEQQGPVPSLNRLALTDDTGIALLPVTQDFAALRKNALLEIITGDRVTVRYVDDRFVTKGRQQHERFLNVAYTDGKVEFADIEPRFSSRHQQLMPYYEELLRFTHDKPLSIVISDADMDITTEPDTIACTITNAAGEVRELIATETGPSTGQFRAWITPVATASTDITKIQVKLGEPLTVGYRDAENLRPGVPYDRVATIRHAPTTSPIIEIAHATIVDYQPEILKDGGVRHHTQALNERFEQWNQWSPELSRENYNDRIKTRYLINQSFVTMDSAPQSGIEVVHGRHVLIDIVAPHLALGAASSVEVFVQTDAGRAAANKAGDTFDPNVPGTLRFVGTLGKRARDNTPQRGGFVAQITDQQGNDYEQVRVSRETGRFRLSVPLITGMPPDRSYADPQEIYDLKLSYPSGLVVKAGERIHIGVAYTDAQGKQRWSTASAKAITRPILDIMQEDYRTDLTDAHVGEKLHLRVVDLAADLSPNRDSVKVYMASKSGQKHYAVLEETEPQSGVFKGAYPLTYSTQDDAAKDKPGEADSIDIRRLGMPVIYGDTVGLRYTDAADRSTPVQYVNVMKGSDGSISPFSKRYDDSDVAMHTQFAMAESYLELARRHRKLGEEEQAQREFTRAKQLLENAITQYNDPETRAHAEYLLGSLTMQDAEATADKELQSDRYQAALARFMKVTSTYPDTAYVSKAQFQVAVLYEQLGEPDIAAQEYVKLAYKYPESEHLATAMARLGTHFQRKAVELETQAKPLLDDADEDKKFDGEALQKLARGEYIKAAQIFERLQQRFPSDELAGKAGLRAGQIYMRAEDFRSALTALKAIIDNESYDGVTLRSEAMYWAGRCYQSTNQTLLAYAMFKRITYDFPESNWAGYARAQLSTDAMLNLDRKLEIERLEEGR